mmetsp:Transcript_31071/g.82666  ORF Transcript_31071/g.82666 Transcript_31071/m.82666 type:complete len:201 (+) Transcript_31071:638-1240(+)
MHTSSAVTTTVCVALIVSISSLKRSDACIASLLPARSFCSPRSSAWFIKRSDSLCMPSICSRILGGIRVSFPPALQFFFSRPIQASASKINPSRYVRNSFSYSDSNWARSGCPSNSSLSRSEWTFLQVPMSRLVFLNQLSWLLFGQKPTKKRLHTSLCFQPSPRCSFWGLSRLGPIRESSNALASSMALELHKKRSASPS